jgi:hypothetical protein
MVRMAIANESTQPMSDHPDNRLIAKPTQRFTTLRATPIQAGLM